MKRKRILSLTALALALCLLTACGAPGAPTPTSEPEKTAEEKYADAQALFDAGELTAAIEAFEALDGFQRSEEYICRAKYALAEQKLADGDFDGAEALFTELGAYSDAPRRIDECRIGRGRYALSLGRRQEAREQLGLVDTEESRRLLDVLDALDRKESLREREIGDKILMGVFEQDNNLDNGPEPISWIIMDRDQETDSILVLSEHIIYNGKIHDQLGTVTWENCSMRQWLNGEFFTTALEPWEQLLVPLRLISNQQDNMRTGADSGPDTMDHVFLLSYDEGVLYDVNTGEGLFGLEASPTAYAKAHGADWGYYGTGWWWMRTSGKDYRNTIYVDRQGIPRPVGFDSSKSKGGIRPAMWISLADDLTY